MTDPSDDEVQRVLDEMVTDEDRDIERTKGHVLDQLQARIKDEDRKKGER